MRSFYFQRFGHKPLHLLPILVFRRLLRELHTSVLEIGWRLKSWLKVEQGFLGKERKTSDHKSVILLDSLLCWSDSEALPTALNTICPEASSLILAEADRICQHSFDLLGSGLASLGKEINWHTDFKAGYQWKSTQFFKRIYPAPFPGGYDIKVPWELSRCQHFARLGQAYWLTKDERYAQEFVTQVRSWLAKNPYPFGVNWACPMDVAIRAVSWLWAWSFFVDSPTFNVDTRSLLLQSLYQHGRHVFANLERIGNLTNNHYLSNIAGLAYLGLLLSGAEAQRWRDFALAELESEMLKQVYPDGVDFEASISYHRLAVELFVGPTLLAGRLGHKFSDKFMQRLEAMVEYVMFYTRPDGTIPLLGDSDNGRLHRLAVWSEPEREWVDHRYLLAIGAVLFGRTDFGQAAGDQWQEAFWLCGVPAVETWSQRLTQPPSSKVSSREFPDGGVYIMRSADHYMIVDAGRNGQNGVGGHAHNDLLSFDVYANGHTWLVDPGTYLYTADYAARNQFRATCSHNTVSVDGQEINPFGLADLFRLHSEAQVVVRHWRSTAAYDALAVEHHGYARLPGQVIHQRRFYFDKINRVWIVLDRVNGQGLHTVTWHFTLAPGVIHEQRSDSVLLRQAAKPSQELWLSGFAHLPLRTRDSWVSWSYGRRTPTQVLEFLQTVELPVQQTFVLCSTSCRYDIAQLSEQRKQAEAYWMDYPAVTGELL